MKKYMAEELAAVLEIHEKWLRGEAGAPKADLRGADLRGANLRHADLLCADLQGANLQGADLQGANLRHADLLHADLLCANLRRADLQGANLQGADLQGANLHHANLHHADLRRAELQGANLQGADLQGAYLQGANLLCAGDMYYIKTMQADTWMIGYTHDTLQIGCERHLISEWWDFEDKEVRAMDSCALEWWRVWKPILKAMIAASPAMPTGAAILAK